MLIFFLLICLKNIFDVVMEGIHHGSQRLILFPDQNRSRLHGRREGEEPKIIKGQVQIKAQCRTHPTAYHIGGVEDQVEGAAIWR